MKQYTKTFLAVLLSAVMLFSLSVLCFSSACITNQNALIEEQEIENESSGNDYLEKDEKETSITGYSVVVPVKIVLEFPENFSLNFLKGEKIDLSGIKVKLVYSDGTSQYVTDYKMSTPDHTVTGTQHISVTYKEFSEVFVINISPYYSKGDVNGDGVIRANDARQTLRAAVGLTEFAGRIFFAGDIDRDEKITANDARVILRCAIGLETPSAEAVSFSDKTASYNGKIKLECEEYENCLKVAVIADRITDLNALDFTLSYDTDKLALNDNNGTASDTYPDFYKPISEGNCNSLYNDVNGNIACSMYFKEYFSYNADNTDMLGDGYEVKDGYILRVFFFDFVDEADTPCTFTVNGKIYVNANSFVLTNDSLTYAEEIVPAPEETPEQPAEDNEPFNFFVKILSFFKKVADFFKKLFGIA